MIERDVKKVELVGGPADGGQATAPPCHSCPESGGLFYVVAENRHSFYQTRTDDVGIADYVGTMKRDF